jgi:DNA-binding NarL/FixJ family response regulator
MLNPSAPDLVLPAPVLVVEDDKQVRRRLQGLMQQLGYLPEALVFAASLKEARTLLDLGPVALALVDLGLPDGSGIDLIAEMHAADPEWTIVVISAWSTADMILAALRVGAVGYVLKERDDLEVQLSLRSVLRGGAPIDPFMARRIIEEYRPKHAGQSGKRPVEQLSETESQVLRFVADGLANREIAERLSLPRNIVECQIKNIYRKLAVS